MDFRLAVLLMVSIALTYFLSQMLWHWRQRHARGGGGSLNH
jgi:hypothetical protein